MTKWMRIGPVADVRNRRITAFKHDGRSIAVFAEGERFFAVDNRCPHMGFPLVRGTLKGGILTCHWHAWQFDASSGGCFTRGGSAVDSFPTEVRGEDLWIRISSDDRKALVERWRRELDRGVRESSTLRLAKSVYTLLAHDVPPAELIRVASGYGTAWREEFSTGLVILTCMANLVRDVDLAVEDRVQALVHGVRQTAGSVRDTPPRRYKGALPGTGADYVQLSDWFRGFVADREEEAAERVLATVIESGTPEQVESMLLSAATDFVFINEGHVLDFINKAFELLGHIGWRHAKDVLPTLVHDLCNGTRHEEDMMWKQPHDLIGMIPDAVENVGKGGPYSRSETVKQLLSDDPEDVASALAVDAPLEELSLAVALAGATRLGRFHTRNEFSDWDWAHHGFTTAQALRRISLRGFYPAARKALVHSAFYVFLERFLNVPKHPMPHERREPSTGGIEDVVRGIELRLPDEIDVAVHATFSKDDPDAMARFVRAALREDLGFHGFQVVDAAVQLHRDLKGTPDAYVPLAAAARFLAAHSPTPRAVAQTVNNAILLQQGKEIHE